MRAHILVASALCSLASAAVAAPPNPLDPESVIVVWQPKRPGNAFSFFTEMMRTSGSPAPLQDFTVAAQLVALNGPGVHQWAFGAATKAIALAGSRSILVGVENTVANMEPTALPTGSPRNRERALNAGWYSIATPCLQTPHARWRSIYPIFRTIESHK